MIYRELGRAGFKVSVLSFGAWQLGDPAYWGSDVEADGEAAVRLAVDSGVNLFDTAEMYGAGESERVLGRALGSRRKDVFVASKAIPEHCAPEELRKACEGSLQRLGTEVIDLYQVHWPFRHVPFDEAHAELERLREHGKVRAIGVSNFGPQDLAAWMRSGSCVSNQVAYNLLFRAIEHEIVPACRRYGLGVLAYTPLMQGLLAGSWNHPEEMPENRRRTRHFAPARAGVKHHEQGFEELTFRTVREIRVVADRAGIPMAVLALAWLIAQPGVSSVIVGARNPQQVKHNLLAATLELSEDLLRQLDEVTRPLKEHLGPNADMWKSGPESRIK